MGIETLLALALQGVGTAGAAGLQAVGLGTVGTAATATTAATAGTGIAGGVAGAASAGATALTGGVAGTGVLGTGATVGEVAAGVTTAASTASSLGAFDKKTKPQSSGKAIVETNVGANLKKKKGKRSVTSTVQGGGLKRNTLG